MKDFMRGVVLLLTLTVLGLLAAPAMAVDLAKIDRSIRKEPVYQSKDPQYCLLVFGPEAKIAVWVVVDGDILYVDRNGNGDLTEQDERIEPRDALHNSPEQTDMKVLFRSPYRPDMKVSFIFDIRRPIKDGRPDGEPILSCVPDAHWFHVEHSIPTDEREDVSAVKFRKKPFRVAVSSYMRYGSDSSLAFASQSGDAPILHFDGPRQLALHPYSQPLRRGETSWLAVRLLTPGLDASVRTYSAEGIESIHPVAEIECPPQEPGAEPIHFRLELPGRG